MKIINNDLDVQNCEHCQSRFKMGWCACSEHCHDHIFTSKAEADRQRRKRKRERKLSVQKVNKQRPSVVKL